MKTLTSNMGLIKAFLLKRGEVISLVGGGGKTTLMFALAQELAANGNPVITTTTTRILEPLPSQTQLLIVERDEERLLSLLSANMPRYNHITLAGERQPEGKLKGIRPELVLRLNKLERPPYIIVEADGAAQRPIKAPNSTEPVIPPNTTLVVPVAGIDALGAPLNEMNVFRAEIAAQLLGSSIGSIITIEDIATLITHRDGITRGTPANARVIPFINKVEDTIDIEHGRMLADNIFKDNYCIERVILGSARSVEPVVEIITEK